MVNFLKKLGDVTADLLSNSDFIQRSVGMANSYEDIMFIVQALGREPISLLGKDYLYIFDHVRRNYNMGTNVMNQYHNNCPKFTFYKEKPTVRFANPYDDPMNLLDRWTPEATFESTSQRNILLSYAESQDDETNNKEIGTKYGIDSANPGVNFGGISSFANVLPTCDILKKTNDNFNHGKYKTLIARFHTKSMDSRDKNDITQTAISDQYGMSHGRNLLKINKTEENGYDNPYCRVWTYHHQYNQLSRAIRPFGDASSQETLESMEQVGDYNTVGFRTVESKEFGFKGGSSRLDKYGVLNYKNGLVNIAPTAKIKDYFEGKTDKEVTIKKCMFSIENLAWKSENVKMDEYDQYGLSAEQKGPLGGRIMWFPPYDLTFSEDVRVNWNPNQFIGRGEKVYTYTDTERTGNLSFTLLIDHPSVLDYWTGHKRNGMKNQGVTLVPGNGGGVDEKDNQENTLLRFFAGCEILTAQPQEFRHREIAPEVTPDPPAPPVPDPPEPEVHKPPTHKAIHCVLYYPNNYSGVDDAPNKNGGTVNAIYYLMNGIGTQKYVKPIICPKCGKYWYPNPSDEQVLSGTTVKYEHKNPVTGEDCDGIFNIYLTAEDIPTQIDTKINNGNNGGYEINGNISVATSNVEPVYSSITSNTYADAVTSHKRAQYLTNGGSHIEVDVNVPGYLSPPNPMKCRLAKIVGSQAMSMKGASTQSNLTGATHQWYRRRWYYRVDKAYENSRLSNKNSYVDTQSFELNGSGYEKLRQSSKISEAFGLPNNNDDVKLISFADLFVALEGGKAESLLSGSFDKGNVEIVKNIMTDTERYKITSIKFEGHASYQGYVTSNNTLSSNRALTFKKWMQSKKFPSIDEATIGSKKESQKNNVDKGDNSELTVKLWRSASVIIEYDESEIEYVSLANSSTVEDGKKDEKTGQPLNKIDKVSIPNGQDSNNIKKPNKLMDIAKNAWTTAFQSTSKEDRIKLLKILGVTNEKYLNELSWDFDNSYLQNQTGITSVRKGIVERYDNEGEFFELLEKNDPFMHHLITDKIRYFDPAFHSISPEGFNARLTFLHQCTRQGSTVGGADSQIGSTAYNLAFGRPPVCVLRLGDFYYTKIIINSISIQYETPQWDLNPEGIGVMPMFAKVSLNFVFLGGSDLAGPISRLQNAVSFNYYANTGVYDNRAEMVQYDPDGSGREVKFKPFSYPDMMHNNGMPKKVSGSTEVTKQPTVTEFNGRTDSPSVGATPGETVTYQGMIDDDGTFKLVSNTQVNKSPLPSMFGPQMF